MKNTFTRKQVKKVEKTIQFALTYDMVTKAADGGPLVISGYANTSTKDRVGDVVLPAAFEKSLPTYLKNPQLLYNHNWDKPCGTVTAAQITDKGLFIKATISEASQDIKTMVKEGVLRTFSIGYNEIDAEYDEATKTKYVKELELLEISIVTVPANTEAMFTMVDAVKAEEAMCEKCGMAKADCKCAMEAAKSAPKTAKSLKDFIDSVKSVVGELTGTEVSAICEYVTNTEEDTEMTKQELIEILRKKSGEAPQAAPAPAAAPEAAKADGAQAPAEGEKPAADADVMKQLMAKLDAIAQACAQLLEGQKPAEAPAPEAPAPAAAPAAEASAPAVEGVKSENDPEEEKALDEALDNEIADLDAQIAALQAQIND